MSLSGGWNPDCCKKWEAGTMLCLAGILYCVAGIQIAAKNGRLEPHPVWAFKSIKRNGVGDGAVGL